MVPALSLIQAASAYIPAEWRQALACGETLPDRTTGAALFADISGFTPLTEALTELLGLRRGAEELPRHLNRVYEALIAEVDRYGGSVISFAGDAITCWFDGDNRRQAADGGRQTAVSGQPSARAVACALAMQQAMTQFAAVPVPGREPVRLAVKVAVASGPARRFLVGDPAIQRKAVLAGATVMRMAVAEHLAVKGETVADEATVAVLGDGGRVSEWRVDVETSVRFAVLASMEGKVSPAPWPLLAADALSEEQVRPWVLQVVYERLQAGLGEFLTELRPVVALFLRFGGIDYDGDDQAGTRLDAYIRWAQATIARLEGTLIQFTVGDKGNYLYAAFGAPAAHEDDARRSVAAALTLRAPPGELVHIGPFQIGISQGTMRTGAYGGTTRRTYGVLGDHVNLAARLMQAASAGQILVGEPVHRAVHGGFIWQAMPPMRIKGKAQLVDTFLLHRPQTRPSIRLQEPAYSLPMVGRQAEMATTVSKMDLAMQGRGQVFAITAEAGMGKSRLAAEVIHVARERSFIGYGGAGVSSGMNASYLVWQPVFQALFGLDPRASLPEQIRSLEGEIEDLAPERRWSLPLLGTVLGLSIPDNDFTAGLEAQYRKSALESLLVDCLMAAARKAGAEGSGLLLVLEDLHWIDPASHDLLEQAARAIAALPVLILLVYRPPELARIQAPRVEKLPYFTLISLTELSPVEMELAIRAKLAQLLPDRAGEPPAALIQRVTARAQGNPF